ncbi:General secretion pathway protein J [gamma proteobacterium IMCC2047]|nr:General secretion pathway protein J [gamma proteobacterium IMCC2047]
MSAPTRYLHGFTLLEVLIALSIFSLIGLAAYRMLDIVILSQAKVTAHQQQIRTLERAMHIISHDFSQLVARPVRDNYGESLAPLVTDQGSFLVEFTRQGWRNPLQLPRSQLQRVAYELGSEPASTNDQYQQMNRTVHLLRHYWTVLDRAQESTPRTQVLMRNIDDLQLLYMDHEGQWQSEWRQAPLTSNASKPLPRAVMLKINSQHIGSIERVYQLTEFSAEQAKSHDRNSAQSNSSSASQSPANPQENRGPKQ